MKQLFATFVLALGLGAAADAHAALISVPGAGMTLDAPDGWAIEPTNSDVVLSAPDGTMTITLASDDAPTADETWDRLGNWMVSRFDNLELGDVDQGELNGMPVQLANATGTRSDEEVTILAGMMTTPADKRLVFIVVSDEAGATHQEEMQQAINSLAVDTSDAGADAGALPADASAFIAKLTKAIESNNVKKFVALISAKFQIGEKNVKKASLKKALVKRGKKKGGIAGYLGLERGEWQILELLEGQYVLYRDDGGAKHTYVSVSKVNGKWIATGIGTLEALG